MIIYNVTCNVEHSVSKDWQKWMREIHIPEVMNCRIFISAKMNKVLSGNDDGDTFSIQYKCDSMKDLHQYEIKFATELKKKHIDRYGDKVISFRTMLEELDKFEK